jgi:hypothetical protein
LAALGTGGLASLAGCGYLHGGGDVRRDARVSGDRPPGPGNGDAFEVVDGRIAHVRNGRQVRWSDDGAQFVDGATVSVTDGYGLTEWDAFHPTDAVAVALDDVAYLLDESGTVLAFGPGGAESGAGTGGSDGGAGQDDHATDGNRDSADDETDAGELWRTDVEDEPFSPAGTEDGTEDEDAERPELGSLPMAAGSGGVYVPTARGATRVADGRRQWTFGLRGTVETVVATESAVAAASGFSAAVLAPDGAARFRETNPALSDLALAGDRGYLLAEDELVAVDAAEGRAAWRVGLESGHAVATATADVVAVFDDGALSVRAATDGSERWRGPRYGASTPVVLAPEGAYAVSRSCQALAFEPGGTVRWRVPVPEADDCNAVAGWLDGPEVVFLLDSGRVVGFQRVDEEPGLP